MTPGPVAGRTGGAPGTGVLVESNTSGTGRLFARAVRAAGLEPLLLAADPGRYPWAAEDGVAVRRVDTGDHRALVEACGGAAEVALVLSSSEYFVATAARLARELGLPGPDADAVQRCRDKGHQRRALAAAGVAVPPFRIVTDPTGAVAAAASIGFPVVVKPTHGSGSVGVRRCDTAAEVGAHAASLLAEARNERGMPLPGEALVEGLVEGPEFSVELFGATPVGVTRKHLGPAPFFVESGHDFPADLPPADGRALCDAAVAACAALGLGWGPAHVELRAAPAGPVVIEVNPRLAGGFIPRLVSEATGIDLIDALVALARGSEPALRASRDAYASIRFSMVPGPGRLAGLAGAEDARAVPGVVAVESYRPVGTELAVQGDFRDRVGHVLARGTTPAAAARAAEAGHARLRVRVAPAREPAAAAGGAA